MTNRTMIEIEGISEDVLKLHRRDSDTPETDAFKSGAQSDDSIQFCESVWRKFAMRLERERDEARKSREFTRDWYAARTGRLSQWIRENKEKLPKELLNQWFSICANGTADTAEPPTYDRLIVELEYKERKAKEECNKWRNLAARMADKIASSGKGGNGRVGIVAEFDTMISEETRI